MIDYIVPIVEETSKYLEDKKQLKDLYAKMQEFTKNMNIKTIVNGRIYNSSKETV